MMPGIDGYDVCERARAEGVTTPILFLTARGSVDDRVRGLEEGGDDYLTKPFHLQELLARVKGILRRQTWYGARRRRRRKISFGDSLVDLRPFAGRAFDGASRGSPRRRR